jgi:hypothetical protein
MKTKTKTAKVKTVKVKTVKVKTVKVKTRTMPAGQFKTHCLSVLDEVHNRREEVVITKYGQTHGPARSSERQTRQYLWLHAGQRQGCRRHRFSHLS